MRVAQVNPHEHLERPRVLRCGPPAATILLASAGPLKVLVFRSRWRRVAGHLWKNLGRGRAVVRHSTSQQSNDASSTAASSCELFKREDAYLATWRNVRDEQIADHFWFQRFFRFETHSLLAIAHKSKCILIPEFLLLKNINAFLEIFAISYTIYLALARTLFRSISLELVRYAKSLQASLKLIDLTTSWLILVDIAISCRDEDCDSIAWERVMDL